ncbi:ferredoxin reductase [Allonocardiopsis opalescens]|uniref:Ferredoxin-NADP reductase n=1 Tax=Allonocardiopsis opalescens TaxID=1144618 RepID=A0A2T0Q9E5_9ACTN|nr:ferredoxin reductase [Allonocardiopsis opalescens]PRY00473.1 ferredoxin-NADP reductase [Allonocardiopsis opalescens]
MSGPSGPFGGPAPGGTVPPGGAVRWQYGRVAAVRHETPSSVTLRLELPHWRPHLPGQHYMVRLTAPDGYTAQRDYSVASPPADTGAIELTVLRVDDGEVSSHLADVVEPGDEIELRGPVGGYFVWTGERPALLIGGGSGVVPLASMLRHRRAERIATPLRLLVSVSRPEDLLYAGEYGAETTVVYTRAAPPAWPGRVGRITAGTLRPLLAEAPPGGWDLYVCGSNGFCEHVAALLVGLGASPTRIRIERFGE